MKIGIIVDNPKRDLNGCSLLAYELGKKNHEVFLIPMYTQGYDIPLLALDLVVLNYARLTNFELIKIYRKLGIKVVVNDTEGGVLSESGLNSPKNWAHFMKSSQIFRYLDGYTFWGENVYNAFVEEGVLGREQLELTGSLRYDFCSKKWVDFLTPEKKDYILVNTNYSAINPVFTKSDEEEIAIFKSLGWDEEYVKTFFNDLKHVFKEFLRSIKELAEEFPQEKFLLRPHPFEDKHFYINEFLSYSNIEINNDGDVLNVLTGAKCVIHLNCGTAIESNLLGKVPVCLDFLNTPIQINHTPLPRKLSYCPQSIDEVKTFIKEFPNSTNRYNFIELQKKYIEPWFYLNDGSAAVRIVQFLEKIAGNKLAQGVSSIYFSLRGSHPKSSLNQRIFGLISFLFGSAFSSKIREYISPERSAKKLYLGQIQKTFSQLIEIEGQDISFEIRHNRNFFGLSRMSTIKIHRII